MAALSNIQIRVSKQDVATATAGDAALGNSLATLTGVSWRDGSPLDYVGQPVTVAATSDAGRPLLLSMRLDTVTGDWNKGGATLELSPLGTLRPPADQLKVLEEHYAVPDSADSSLITISELPGFTEKQFNTLSNAQTRELTITGVQLKWDGSVEKLDVLRLLRDVTKVTVIADEVDIALPIQWKGADVEIFARRLVFQGAGSISTKPEPYPANVEAFAANRDKDGRPLADPTNPAKIRAADGRPGEAGGDIKLFVHEIDTGGTANTRLICDGSDGEKGETGGLLPFPGLSEQPPRPKDVPPVSIEQITTAINDSSHSTPDINGLGYWWYPGDSTYTGDLYGGLQGRQDFNAGRVTDVRLLMYFQKFLVGKVAIVRIPQGDASIENADSWDQYTGYTPRLGNDIPLSSPSAGDRRVPGNGEDAFPSGTSGKGGDSGTVYTTPALLAASIIRCKGGESPMASGVKGGAPGKPEKPLFVDILITEKTWVSQSPEIHYHEYQPGWGDEVKTGSNSARGADRQTVSSILPTDDGESVPIDASAWLEPRLLQNVISYAKIAYRNGQRQQAWTVLQPYWEALKDKTGVPALSAPKQLIDGLLDNLAQNLDLYGYPPGWVPRFSADSYLQTYLADRKFSYRFCYVMSKAATLMNSIEHATEMLTIVADQGEAAIVKVEADLFEAYRHYDSVRDDLQRTQDLVASTERALNDIKNWATNDGMLAKVDQAVVKGLFSIAGAVLSAIPVYQPALAGVATIVQGIGEVVTSDPAGQDPPTASDYMAKITGSVSTVLSDNAATFKSKFDDALKTKYATALGKDKDKDDLAASIAKLKASIAEQQQKVDGSTEDAYDAVLQDTKLAPLLKTDSPAPGSEAQDPVALKKKLDEYNALIIDLKDKQPGQNPLANELAAAKKQNLIAARAKLRAQLADAQVKVNAVKRDKAKAAADREAAEKAKKDLADSQEKLDKLLAQQDKAQAEADIKDTNTKFANALDGVQRMAKGAASIAGAINAMVKPVKADDPGVIALRDQLLNSRYKDKYKAAMASADKARQQLAGAVSSLQASNQTVRTLTGNLNSALQASIDVSRNRQAMAIGFDAGLKSSIAEMQRQAADRMDFYLYLFRKAYLYEFCAPVGDQMANINTFVSELDNWVRQNKIAAGAAPAAKPGADSMGLLSVFAAMKDDDLSTAGNDALKNTLADLARNIVSHRDQVGAAFSNTYPLSLSPEMVAKLSTTGELDLNEVAILIPDLYETSPSKHNFFEDNAKVRIAGVTIPSDGFAFKMVPNVPQEPIRIDISFGREFVLRDGPNYYMFRLAPNEVALRYGVVVTALKASDDLWTGTSTPDVRTNVDELFKTMMTESAGATPTYNEMCPSILTSMNVALTIGRDLVQSIERLTLALTLQVN